MKTTDATRHRRKLFHALRVRGGGTRKVKYAVDVRKGGGALVRAAHGMFSAWRPGKRKEAFFFIDDYIARGAITALIENGIRIGEDVNVGALSNVGMDLVFAKDITRLEFDARSDTDKTFDAIISYLESGFFPAGVTAAPVFVPGVTL